MPKPSALGSRVCYGLILPGVDGLQRIHAEVFGSPSGRGYAQLGRNEWRVYASSWQQEVEVGLATALALSTNSPVKEVEQVGEIEIAGTKVIPIQYGKPPLADYERDQDHCYINVYAQFGDQPGTAFVETLFKTLRLLKVLSPRSASN